MCTTATSPAKDPPFERIRETLAWRLARGPGGAVADAIQYRHLSIQMFEGYAGTSDSGFRAEVEAEQALARGEHLLAIPTDHDHSTLTGPAAEEARRLTDLAARAGFGGTVVTTPPGSSGCCNVTTRTSTPAATSPACSTPAKAMCQPRPDSHGTTRPRSTACQPLDCRDTAPTAENHAALRDERDRIDTDLAQRPPLPPLLEHRLSSRRDKIDAFLTGHRSQGQS